MSTTLNEHISSAPTTTPGVTRVAIREVREVAFRSLVAAGASNAEARVAAEQVMFTELHWGSGLVGLLEELSSGPWARAGLACERDDSGEQLVFRVTGSGRRGALGQGALLVDLLAAHAESGAVVASDGLDSLSPMLDEPLIRAAKAAERWVIAADRSTTSIDFRAASPDGAIGVGGITIVTDLPSGQAALPHGISLTLWDLSPEWDITWLTAAEQWATRSQAAQHGILVDSAVWAQVKTAAYAYLVPEQ